MAKGLAARAIRDLAPKNEALHTMPEPVLIPI